MTNCVKTCATTWAVYPPCPNSRLGKTRPPFFSHCQGCRTPAARTAQPPGYSRCGQSQQPQAVLLGRAGGGSATGSYSASLVCSARVPGRKRIFPASAIPGWAHPGEKPTRCSKPGRSSSVAAPDRCLPALPSRYILKHSFSQQRSDRQKHGNADPITSPQSQKTTPPKPVTICLAKMLAPASARIAALL